MLGTTGRVLRSLILTLLGWVIMLVVLVSAFLLGAEAIPRLPHLQQQPPDATQLPAGDSGAETADTPAPFVHP